MYDLREDPGEWLNLYADQRFAAQREKLTRQLAAFFDRYADPKYDLWKGGTAQTVRLMKPTQ